MDVLPADDRDRVLARSGRARRRPARTSRSPSSSSSRSARSSPFASLNPSRQRDASRRASSPRDGSRRPARARAPGRVGRRTARGCGGVVDVVADVVERGREPEDVVAVERRHERAVERGRRPRRQPVALVLALLDLARSARGCPRGSCSSSSARRRAISTMLRRGVREQLEELAASGASDLRRIARASTRCDRMVNALTGTRERTVEAAARRAGGLDRAAGRGDDVLHDREAEPGAARRARAVGAVEALEEAREVLVGDALPVVGDRRARRRRRAARRTAAARARAGVADRVRRRGSRARPGACAAAAGPRGRPGRRRAASRPARAAESRQRRRRPPRRRHATGVAPSATTSRPVSSSERKRTSSISSADLLDLELRALDEQLARVLARERAVSSSDISRASGVRSSCDTAAVNPQRSSSYAALLAGSLR